MQIVNSLTKILSTPTILRAFTFLILSANVFSANVSKNAARFNDPGGSIGDKVVPVKRKITAYQQDCKFSTNQIFRKVRQVCVS